MRIRLNLATKPLVTHRKFIAGSTLVGFIAAVVFLSLGWHVYVARKANAEVRAKTANIVRQMDELEQQRATLKRFFALDANAKLHDRADFINSLIDARSFNWTFMFMDLERVLPGGVRVISIDPKQEKGHIEVKLVVGATSDDAKHKLIKALEDSKTFTHIELVSELQPSSGTNVDRIVVELKAEYLRT